MTYHIPAKDFLLYDTFWRCEKTRVGDSDANRNTRKSKAYIDPLGISHLSMPAIFPISRHVRVGSGRCIYQIPSLFARTYQQNLYPSLVREKREKRKKTSRMMLLKKLLEWLSKLKRILEILPQPIVLQIA